MPLARLLAKAAMSAFDVKALRGISGTVALSIMMEGKEPDEDEDLEEITVPVASSAIRSVSYRGDDTITVEFVRGGTYTYEGTKDVFIAFVNAPSVGGFFNAHFK